MRTDDAVGMLAMQQLRADPRFPRSVSLIEGGTLGLDLLIRWTASPICWLSMLSTPGATPGTLLRLQPGTKSPSADFEERAPAGLLRSDWRRCA